MLYLTDKKSKEGHYLKTSVNNSYIYTSYKQGVGNSLQ